MATNRGWSRRRFLSGAAAGGPLLLAAPRLGAQAPSNRIALGFIGVGSHGLGYNLKSFLQQEDCRAVAVCDVVRERREAAARVVNEHYGDAGCRQFADFRDLLEDRSIDAVCISTPDHWHVPMAIMAAEAGKDVICEKPTLSIAEGRTLVETFARTDRVFQLGLEDRSLIHYHKLAEWVRNGAIGELRRMLVGLPEGKTVPAEPAEAPPAGFDYEMWLGPAPFAPYSRTRTEPMVWRQIRDYSGGMLTDWGAHLVDTAQVANFAERTGPVEVEGEGTIPEGAMTTTATEFTVRYRYANGVEMEVRSTGPSIRLDGTKGWVSCTGWRGRLEAEPADILQRKYAAAESRLWPRPVSEHRDFLDAVRSRKPTIYPPEDAHRLSTALHIGVISIELRRRLRWDPVAESFVDDEEANRRRARPPREDWRRLPRRA